MLDLRAGDQQAPNNISSFAPRGAIVGDVPSGTGMLVLASDQLEVYANKIHGNRTTGLAIVNYGIVSTTEGDRKYDFYPEGIHVYGNAFDDNGGNPQMPDNSRNGCKGDQSLPAGVPSTSDLNQFPDCMTNNATLLVSIIEAKNYGKSAQIVWDGGVDPGVDAKCPVAGLDRDGIPVNQDDPNDVGHTKNRYEARYDEHGRPNYYIYDYPPACQADTQHHTYNAWKFDASGKLQKGMGLCIESNNTFTKSPTNPADPYVNVHFSTADPTVAENQQPSDTTLPSDCPSVPAPLLAEYVPQLGSFTPNPANDPRPSLDQLTAVCDAVQPGQVNYPALLAYNCPRLDQYGLFADATDPTRNPNGTGVPYDLNTPLFSDYAVKTRILFLPPGQKATYVDSANCHDHGVIQIFDCNTATLDFPVGTVIAKTFSFRKNNVDDNVETRLLIKRPASDGARWIGMAPPAEPRGPRRSRRWGGRSCSPCSPTRRRGRRRA